LVSFPKHDDSDSELSPGQFSDEIVVLHGHFFDLSIPLFQSLSLLIGSFGNFFCVIFECFMENRDLSMPSPVLKEIPEFSSDLFVAVTADSFDTTTPGETPERGLGNVLDVSLA
jgi:hypothetical protein